MGPPETGVIEPDQFIPILEETGQIQQVGQWVLQESCRQLAIWHAQRGGLYMSINVSARQLDHDAIVEHVGQAVHLSGVPASSLTVEVTETALMLNGPATAERLQAIRDFGVRVAVDDFGTGYSSLAQLDELPVDCLKIDRRFVDAMVKTPRSGALIRTLVRLGHDMGMTTVAEGVETVTQMDQLRQEHVKEVQGFLLSRPLDASAVATQMMVAASVSEASRP